MLPPKALQSHYYRSPWKNEETEAKKEKVLGHRDPVCGDREEVKVLLPGCSKLGTEWGTPLPPIPPEHSQAPGICCCDVRGQTCWSWLHVERKS